MTSVQPTAATSTSNPPASPATAPKPVQTQQLPPTGPRKADTNMSWGSPLGLKMRGPNDENLVIFRKALGINYHLDCADGCTVEEGRRSAIGIYKTVIDTQGRKRMQHAALTAFLYTCYFSQIVIGAALTALGASTDQGKWVITLLGALNTVLAGVLAMIKGSGQPQKLGRDLVEYRKLQDWIEETEALLAVGVIGRNRREVGRLVESAFKRYNAAKASEENNQPDMYVNSPLESLGNRDSDDMIDARGDRRTVG
ncbi:hypothetical protein DL771_009715 [Monosporascus sp. 5C6A]|nr:hypothetical protein DL771_009715 [Monosporascus sp. 5C6A]